MKRIAVCALVLILSSLSLRGEEVSKWGFHSELDLYLGLKAGFEYRISDHFGFRGSLGACLINPSQFSYTLIGIAHVMKPEKTFQLDLQCGLIQANLNFLDPELEEPYSYWIPGICAAVGFRTSEGHHFGIRGGAGISFGYDLGMWQNPSVMPNLAIEYGYSAYK